MSRLRAGIMSGLGPFPFRAMFGCLRGVQNHRESE
jgi:hypothetical protein